MDPLAPLRLAKHALFVAAKRCRGRYRVTKFDIATRLFKHGERQSWHYRPQRYPGSFLQRDATCLGASQLPERVFVLWTGDNELTPNRSRNLSRLRAELGVPVVLVTSDSVGDWLVHGHPLHPAYEHLSLVHRSDYLRGYLMHHHGGGYADVKAPVASWRPVFAAMAADDEAWVSSYRATHANWIGKTRGRLGRDILVHYRRMFGKGAFVMRSHTPLTAEWLGEMDRRLDAVEADLAASQGGGVFGSEEYPLSWTDLLGRILDPLTLKHHQHVRYDERLLLEFTDYR